MLRYVGDSKRLRSRVRQHCKGNVESSALRKTIAAEMGFEIVSKKRPSGSRKLSAEPSNAEQIISAYIQSGTWRVVANGMMPFLFRKIRPFVTLCKATAEIQRTFR